MYTVYSQKISFMFEWQEQYLTSEIFLPQNIKSISLSYRYIYKLLHYIYKLLHYIYKPTTPIFYCSQSVLVFYSRPLENNRKWVWYVYKQHNNLLVPVGLVIEIQDLALRAWSWISVQDLPLGYYPIYNDYNHLIFIDLFHKCRLLHGNETGMSWNTSNFQSEITRWCIKIDR